jgi:hypothetical protein
MDKESLQPNLSATRRILAVHFLFAFAARTAYEVAANLGHLDPGRILVRAFEGLVGAT